MQTILNDYYWPMAILYVLSSIFLVKFIYNLALKTMGDSKMPKWGRIMVKYSGPVIWFMLGLVFTLVFIPC